MTHSMLSTRDFLRSKDTRSCKWKGGKIFHASIKHKGIVSGCNDTRQNRIQVKNCYKKQRSTLHTDKSVNPSQNNNNCKHIHS